jgi:hypothetical protein
LKNTRNGTLWKFKIETERKLEWRDLWYIFSAIVHALSNVCAIKCSTVQYSTVQYIVTTYSTVQYSTVQYSTVHCHHIHKTSPRNSAQIILSIFCILTFILLTWRIGCAPNNTSKWQMGFNSGFKWLTQISNFYLKLIIFFFVFFTGVTRHCGF